MRSWKLLDDPEERERLGRWGEELGRLMRDRSDPARIGAVLRSLSIYCLETVARELVLTSAVERWPTARPAEDEIEHETASETPNVVCYAGWPEDSTIECSRADEHEGDHIAVRTGWNETFVVARWPQEHAA